MRHRESAKDGKVLESDLPKIWGFHTLAEKTAVGYHDAFGDHRIYGRNCPSNNRFAQVLSDRDQVEGGSSADHSNAWDSHRVKLRFT